MNGERTTCNYNETNIYLISTRRRKAGSHTNALVSDSIASTQHPKCEPLIFSHYFSLLIRKYIIIIIDLHNVCIQIAPLTFTRIQFTLHRHSHRVNQSVSQSWQYSIAVVSLNSSPHNLYTNWNREKTHSPIYEMAQSIDRTHLPMSASTFHQWIVYRVCCMCELHSPRRTRVNVVYSLHEIFEIDRTTFFIVAIKWLRHHTACQRQWNWIETQKETTNETNTVYRYSHSFAIDFAVHMLYMVVGG